MNEENPYQFDSTDLQEAPKNSPSDDVRLSKPKYEKHDPSRLEEGAEVIEFWETRRNSLLSSFVEIDDVDVIQFGSCWDEPDSGER